jgi:hypothetical protein
MTTSLKRSKGSQSSLRIGTYSFWIKLTQVGAFNIYSNTVESDNNRGYFQLTSDNKWRMVDNDASGTHIQLRTNRLFRDFNAWYHMVVRVDTTQSTNTDRVRLYVNGVQETSFDQTDYPAQNDDLKIFQGGQTNREYINNIYGGSASSPNFYLSHFHYADGQSYGPDTFGSTDATTGEWKINTNPTVTYGNQGFFMFKNDASLNDDSGNSNNWTSDSGTIQKSEDNPSNVFATLNYLASLPNTGASTFTNGNTTSQGTNASYVNGGSTLMMSSGKFYAEMKYVATSNASRCWVGITEDVSEISRINQDVGSLNVIYRSQTGGLNIEGGGENSYGATFTTGDIIGIALDLDNNRLFFSKNGTWQNSGDPTSSTGAITTFTAPASTRNGGWFFASGSDSNAQNNTVSWNFGNGYFGTTAVSSAGTNASNLGIFEYDVPSGYTALCTKGLNE